MPHSPLPRFAFLVVFALSAACALLPACASKETKPPVDHSAIRARAEGHFDDLDQATGTPPAKKSGAKKAPDKAPDGTKAPEKSSQNLPIPSWVTAKPGENEVLGEVEGGRTQTDAIAGAKNKAFSELAMRAGVTVSANLEIKDEASSNGTSSFEIRDTSKLYAVPLKVEKFEFKQVFARQEEGGFHGWALLSVPREEFARIKRNLDGMVAFRLECDPAQSPKGKDLCLNSAFEKKLRELAVGRAIKLRNTSLANSPNDLPVLGETENVAYYLATKVEISKTYLDNPEHYVWVTLTWRLMHTDKGAPLREVTVGPIKGGHYSYEDATQVAFKKALDELKEKLDSADSSTP